jgi:hypothetical protein
MSGALNGIFGGGNILGLVMSIASIAFPPAALMSSLTNLFTQALGTALKAGIDMLVQQGMPKFVGEIAKQIVDGVIGKNQQQTDPEADKAVKQSAGSEVKNWGEQLQKDFVEATMDKVKEGNKKKGKPEGEKVSAGSWLEAIALAMAEAMANKAAKMIDLSDKIKQLSEEKTGDDSDAQKKNAGEMNRANAQLNAAGKEYELLTNTMKSVIDSIGNAMAQAARKS